MARDENPPFLRGEGYWSVDYTPTAQDIIDTNHMEGKEWLFEDIDWSDQGAKAQRTNRLVRCRVVRNTSTGNLLPKRLVSFEIDQVNGQDLIGRVDGYADTTAEQSYPTDEFLPAAGIQSNNLLYVVMEGPAVILSPLTADASNLLPVGTVVVALTAATSGATSAGRVSPQSLVGATAVLALQIQNRIGYALTALTTGQTNSDILIDVSKF